LGVFPRYPHPLLTPLEFLQFRRDIWISQRLIVIEKPQQAFSSLVLDFPSCIATGRDQGEIEGEMKSAIRFHIDGLIEDGLPAPKPTNIAEYVEALGNHASTTC
jgi:predicted RNase H-like HicB family nuclease